jgi:hypothetical protein
MKIKKGDDMRLIHDDLCELLSISNNDVNSRGEKEVFALGTYLLNIPHCKGVAGFEDVNGQFISWPYQNVRKVADPERIITYWKNIAKNKKDSIG